MFLKEEDRQIVDEILNRLASNLDVFVFGSRATGEHLKKFSDLDLAFVSKNGKIESKVISKLKHEFEESDLPIRVDIGRRKAQGFSSAVTTADFAPYRHRSTQQLAGHLNSAGSYQVAQISTADNAAGNPYRGDNGHFEMMTPACFL